MREHKKSIIVISIISLFSFSVCLLLFNTVIGTKNEFWLSIFLGIFSNTVLAIILAFISYRVNKTRTLEKFFYHTRILLKYLNLYQNDATTDEKIDYFINYYNLDKITWDSCLGDISFLFDRRRRKYLYIYSKIYKPLKEVEKVVDMHINDFIAYKSIDNGNTAMMEQIIEKIEAFMICKRVFLNNSIDSKDNVRKTTFTDCFLVKNISKELNSGYYKLMYGKSQHKLNQKQQTDLNNNVSSTKSNE